MQIDSDKEFEFPLKDCPYCDNSGKGHDARSGDPCTHNFTIKDYYAMGPVIVDIEADLLSLKGAQKQMIKIVTVETTGIKYD